MDYYLLTDLAARVGYHLALSGAETFRVEETIRRIIGAYGIECEAFSIPNCVMVSLEAANGKPLMVMKRVGFHGNDLESVEKLNALSRRICAETPDPSVAAQWLDETLKGRRHYSVPVYYLGNFCAAAGFCPVFGGTLRDSLFAGLLGLIIGFVSRQMDRRETNPFFSTIVEAVREGRGIFDNIRKFLRYLLSSNVGEVFTVFGGVMLAGFLGITQPGSQGVTVPLLATQLLWINLLTDAAPALAMGVDPSTDDVMARKPRKLTDRVIDGQMWGDIIFIGLIMAAVTLIGMDMHLAGGLFTDRSVDAVGHDAQMTEARTMGFTILVFAQMLNALCSRSHDQSVFVGLFANKWLWGAIALSALLQVVVIYVPFLNTAFGTMPLSAGAWVECLGLAMVVLVASELRKCVLRAMRE